MRERLGELHILVNNAAILDMTGIEALTLERFEHVLRINLTGAVACTVALLPFMTAGWGRILNIGSIMGERGQPDAIPYSTAKGGIANFTRALAADVGKRGITANAIAPGFIDTRMALLPDGSRPRARDRLVQGHLPEIWPHPAGPRRQARRHRRACLLPVLGGQPLRHRAGAAGRRGSERHVLAARHQRNACRSRGSPRRCSTLGVSRCMDVAGRL